MTQADGYLLDNRQSEAGQRFDAFARLFDPTTFRHLEASGLTTGWRCWEVGAGGTSVVSWLAAKVGPAGQVVATDIDTSLLAPTAPAASATPATPATPVAPATPAAVTPWHPTSVPARLPVSA
ncbi:hypothetical protein ACFWIJ_06380, partial [Streptomyces sp. NPDC127079]